MDDGGEDYKHFISPYSLKPLKPMTTIQAPPIFSLQNPKDVSLNDIEAELLKIWQGYGGETGDSPAAMRATTFTFVVYEPEETQHLLSILGFYTGPIDGILGPRMVSALKAAQKTYGLPRTGKADEATKTKLREEYLELRSGKNPTRPMATDFSGSDEGYGMADAIAAANPCRIIALCPISGADTGVEAQVSAYCPIQKRNQNTLVCCEYITLRGTPAALERIGGVVEELLIGELPKFLWWKATPDENNPLFRRLAGISSTVIIDSSAFPEPELDLLQMGSLVEKGIAIADLNWRRLAAWQELTASAFDPPERRAAIKEIDRITIDYETGNPSQAFLFLGWLASRLQWRPVGLQKEGGDYNLMKIHFVGADQRPIEAELAAIPLADVGEIVGDLIAIRLTSTNIKADCGTVLCSESGCMRMEAGGVAQSAKTYQVTPLFDQKTEFLLSQQLQRWGREMLYEESLAICTQILRLAGE